MLSLISYHINFERNILFVEKMKQLCEIPEDRLAGVILSCHTHTTTHFEKISWSKRENRQCLLPQADRHQYFSVSPFDVLDLGYHTLSNTKFQRFCFKSKSRYLWVSESTISTETERESVYFKWLCWVACSRELALNQTSLQKFE
jgi:hypothetical protein